MNKHVCILALLSLSACSEMDMQGIDPNKYYAQHPIENKVGHKLADVDIAYTGSVAHIDAANIKKLHEVRPEAVESLNVELSAAMLHNPKRRASIMRLTSQWGYHVPVEFEAAETMDDAHDVIHIAYAAVISPDCPDWKQSPVTSYSNITHPANIGCAITTNLGLMLVDPRDLERGSSGGNIAPDAERSADAIAKYHTGLASGSSSAAPAAASAGASSAAPPAVSQ